MFSLRGLRLYFPGLEPWVTQSASLPTLVPVYLCVSVGPRGATRHSACPVLHQSEFSPLDLSVCDSMATVSASGQTACPVRPTLRQSWSRHSHVSPLRPSYLSGCMFLFDRLVVRLPCRSILCQFWLCEEAQCVYLRHHLGSRYCASLIVAKLVSLN